MSSEELSQEQVRKKLKYHHEEIAKYKARIEQLDTKIRQSEELLKETLPKKREDGLQILQLIETSQGNFQNSSTVNLGSIDHMIDISKFFIALSSTTLLASLSLSNGIIKTKVLSEISTPIFIGSLITLVGLLISRNRIAVHITKSLNKYSALIQDIVDSTILIGEQKSQKMMMTVLLGEKKVKEFVSRACREVELKDIFLLEKDVSEWAIAHRLAVYLEKYFPEFNVDCEYNRMPGEDGKYGEEAPKKLYGQKKIRPDIIVHHRGSNNANLLAIELKKSTNRTGTEDDRRTLLAMREELYYTNLCQILISKNELKETWL